MSTPIKLCSPSDEAKVAQAQERTRREVLSDGFEYESRRFRSLSAIAREVTGTRWNGLLFFGLAERRDA